MPNVNGHGPKQAILYARVSTEDQARDGYSVGGQLDELREYAAAEGLEVLKEVVDPGGKRWTLDRPGIDRIRDRVAAGGVDVVLAWRWDRFGESPWPEVLALELEEYGCKLRSLDDSGEGEDAEILRGLKGLIAKRERRRITERSRMGKLRKVREGKVIAGRMAKYGIARYGFKFNESRDALVVDEERMAVVKRVFYMIGVEGRPISAVKSVLEAEGVPTATGKKRWATTPIRDFVKDDIYKPHTYEEVKVLVSPDVAAQLDPEKRYGLWRYGRRRFSRTQVSEPSPNGRAYRQQQRWTFRPEEEWHYVPVPDSGIPREWVDAAREAIKDNRRASNAGRRFWELSGGIVRCGSCGHAMYAHTTPDKGRRFFYYACKTKYKKGSDTCPKALHVPAAKLEGRIWEEVCGILKAPEQLRADLDAMIELERGSVRGDPDREAKLWGDKLSEVDRKRARYQEMAAADLVTFDELRARLAELDEARRTAERELASLRNRQGYISELERDRDDLLGSLMEVTPDALESLTPEERHQFYKMLRLKVIANLDGSFEVSGVFGESLSLCTFGASR